uniref:Uncharacterized protein n=1 Tax=Anguilla anguilla TaxID=7936 RepID=A0A0E9RR63_ANGAN
MARHLALSTQFRCPTSGLRVTLDQSSSRAYLLAFHSGNPAPLDPRT